MDPSGREEDKHRVILHGIGENSEEERSLFCREISEHYGIPASLLKKVVDRCPIVIKKDLPLRKAEVLALTLNSFGASVSVERKREIFPLHLEFQGEALSQLAVESLLVRKSPSGQWHLIGRVRNISDQDLLDAWVLVQLFDESGELITFEETSLPVNPLPSETSVPFRVIFEKNLSPEGISIFFKNASGQAILSADRRKKREWEEIIIPGMKKREVPFSPSQTSREPSSSPESGTGVFTEQEPPTGIDQDLDKVPEEIRFSSLVGEPPGTEETTGEEHIDLTLDFFEGDEQREEQRSEMFSTRYPRGQEIQTILKEEEKGREEQLPPSDSSETPPEEGQQGGEPDSRTGEKLTQEVEEQPGIFMKVEKEELVLYPWIEEFRRSIEGYRRTYQDSFTAWFKVLLEEGGTESTYHSLLTIFAYARFNQDNHPSKALENTKTVFKLLLKPDLALQEIPFLEGTSFIQGEAWKNLFFRAIPKIQEVAKRVLERTRWDALDLDRLVRIIPHMSDRSSRWAIQSIGESIPGAFEIDFSQLPVHVGESLYRVASRLGIINPFFDCYQGRHSMGDKKIQFFARIAFRDNPARIEDPMTRVGTPGEEGHCFPSHPRCEGCPFNHFCPKLFFELDPSEKGIIHR